MYIYHVVESYSLILCMWFFYILLCIVLWYQIVLLVAVLLVVVALFPAIERALLSVGRWTIQSFVSSFPFFFFSSIFVVMGPPSQSLNSLSFICCNAISCHTNACGFTLVKQWNALCVIISKKIWKRHFVLGNKNIRDRSYTKK